MPNRKPEPPWYNNLYYATKRWVMKLKVIVHEAEEGGYWAEVPAIPGCATQGDTLDDLMRNLHEAIEGCLSIDVQSLPIGKTDRILEIAV